MGGARSRFLHQQRRRIDRRRAEAGARLRARQGCRRNGVGQAKDALPRDGKFVSRPHVWRALGHVSREIPRAIRASGSRRRIRSLQRHRRSRCQIRRIRLRHRDRADPGRRRDFRSVRRLLAARAPAHLRPRRRADRGRNPERPRPHRPQIRVSEIRRAAGHRDGRETAGGRPPARRVHRQRTFRLGFPPGIAWDDLRWRPAGLRHGARISDGRGRRRSLRQRPRARRRTSRRARKARVAVRFHPRTARRGPDPGHRSFGGRRAVRHRSARERPADQLHARAHPAPAPAVHPARARRSRIPQEIRSRAGARGRIRETVARPSSSSRKRIRSRSPWPRRGKTIWTP